MRKMRALCVGIAVIASVLGLANTATAEPDIPATGTSPAPAPGVDPAVTADPDTRPTNAEPDGNFYIWLHVDGQPDNAMCYHPGKVSNYAFFSQLGPCRRSMDNVVSMVENRGYAGGNDVVIAHEGYNYQGRRVCVKNGVKFHDLTQIWLEGGGQNANDVISSQSWANKCPWE